jgi:hypothetical protein
MCDFKINKMVSLYKKEDLEILEVDNTPPISSAPLSAKMEVTEKVEEAPVTPAKKPRTEKQIAAAVKAKATRERNKAEKKRLVNKFL